MLLGVTIRLEGDRVVIEGLGNFSEGVRTKAIPNALRTIASGTAREALYLLTGPARGVKTVTAKKSGRQRAVSMNPEDAGGYPVPRVTGNLRRLLDWMGPNSSKDGFSTGPLDAVVFDSAEYSRVIHEGEGSSEKWGARPFLDDAFKAFNGQSWQESDRVAQIIEDEIAEVVRESGLE